MSDLETEASGLAFLLPVSISLCAVVAKPIATGAAATFGRWNVSSRRAGTVVVVDPFRSGFSRLIDGVEGWNLRHSFFSNTMKGIETPMTSSRATVASLDRT